ncbi:MAG: small ribosomal subunit Rsm22 family protein [Candidatus Wallacebacter cryptica]|jgi:ribosomal protein RSM22 (predicted rRNA methylase)|nr:rRNA methyltransferase [Bacillota bacterium]
MELPERLRDAIEAELNIQSSKQLAKLTADLSQRYREDPSDGRTFIRSQADVEAYAAFRMPATFGAAGAVLDQVQEVLPAWQPQTLLDIGAGPGTVMWAAASRFPSLKAVDLVEREADMIRFGRRLAGYAENSLVKQAKWIQGDIRDQELKPHDLVTAAYVLGELDSGARADFVSKLWEAANGTLVIIEPGTTQGFARIREAREQLIALGAQIAAPCPHQEECPITGSNWCHFSQRVARSSLHRQIKSGELGYEDEKFSYVAAARFPGRAVYGRILRHPQVRKGHIIFEVCGPDGLETKIISRRQKDLYRLAKELQWGSVFPDE